MFMERARLRCREITADDLKDVAALLSFGFQDQRARNYWDAALQRLATHATPPGYPRFGYLLEAADAVVGVILQIFYKYDAGDVRCNMSSWWVQPDYRAYGGLLISRALRHSATYTNITPAPQTIPILEAQGYQPYCSGRVVALGWLSRKPVPARVRSFDPAAPGLLSPAEVAILRDHAGYGCICLVCEADGRCYPFVFAPRRRLRVVGLAVLTYCRADADFARFAAVLGRALALRGFPLAVVDADGPIPGVVGRYSGNRPKYFRGPDRPRLGDCAYTERALFGS